MEGAQITSSDLIVDEQLSEMQTSQQCWPDLTKLRVNTVGIVGVLNQSEFKMRYPETVAEAN